MQNSKIEGFKSPAYIDSHEITNSPSSISLNASSKLLKLDNSCEPNKEHRSYLANDLEEEKKHIETEMNTLDDEMNTLLELYKSRMDKKTSNKTVERKDVILKTLLRMIR